MRLIILNLVLLSSLFGIWLTQEQAVLSPPFKTASLGWKINYPFDDSYIIRGDGDKWKFWFRVDLLTDDTTLFLDDSTFNYKGDDLYVSDFIFSKNGNKILIKTDSKQIWRHSTEGTYYVYDRISEHLMPLTEDNSKLRNVKFSPDEKNIAFIKSDNNIYVFNIQTKRQKKLTTSGSETISNGHFGWLYEEELTGFDGYRWSPDSENIAYWEEDESKVPEYSLINDLGLYPKVTKIRYPKVGQTNPSLRIGVIRVKGAGKKWISGAFTNDDYLPWMEWVNNDRLGFTKMGRRQKKWDLFISNKANGSSHKILSESDPNGWVDNHGEIYFLKDGKVLWISENSKFKHIWISKHSGSKKWALTEGEWEVSKVVYINEKENVVYFIGNKESVFDQNLYSIRLDGTDLKLLTREAGFHNVEVTNSGKYFIDSYSSSKNPMKIALRELKTGKTIRVLKETDVQQYVKYEWSYPNITSFKSLDKSVDLYASIIFPPDFSKNKSYPVIIHGYGMPGTQLVWNKWGKTFDQYLAQQGYIVFSMDTRGMSGRGEDFKNYSYGDMAKYLAGDQIAGIKYLTSKKYVDKSRIGAWGWSGGGYFTCLMLTKNAEYFKAGVAIAPCTDFRLYDTAYTERSMGLLSENKKGYDSTNTLNWINKMKGKLLIMHGSEDDNVHSQHTTHFINKALRANKNVVWHQYPGRNHGIYGGGARKDLYNKMIEFFRENL